MTASSLAAKANAAAGPAALPALPPLPAHIPARLQDMDAHGARLVLRVERLLRGEMAVDLSGAGLLAGVSGGTDSLALLVILAALRERLKCRLAVCHVNHCLRPGAAAEQDWVARVCACLDVKFYGRTVDVAALSAKRRIGLEEAGREARLAAFREIAAQEGGLYLATGHTLDDLGEDVLMRLLRGSGWPALAGMDRFNAEHRILRPLLFVERRELAAFLKRLGLPHLEDESNHAPDFLRNRLRLKVTPLLRQENPAWLNQVRTLKGLAEIDADYWQEEVRLRPVQVFAPGKARPGFSGPDPARAMVFLSREQLHAAPKALRLRLFMHCLRLLGGGQALADNLLALDRAWAQNPAGPQGGKIIQLPGNTAARTTKDGIWFYFQACA